MPRRPQSVADLAREAGLDLDEALVALWDVGIESVEGGRDVVPSRQLPSAYKALGLNAPSEVSKVDYWLIRTGLKRDEFAAKAATVGVLISHSARRVPKGAVRKLTRLFGEPTISDMGIPELTPLPELRWEVIGSECSVRLLTEDEVLGIHDFLEEEFAQSNDPIWPPGVRDRNLLSSAIARQHTSFGDTDKYPTVEMATAALFHSLTLNHPFYNGNKRTALVSMLAQLDENGLVLTATEEELFRFTLRTAQHGHVPLHADLRADREVQAVARWIKGQSRPVDKSEKPLKWVRLKQRLSAFECTCEASTGVGNRVNIYRIVPGRRRVTGGHRTQTLSTQVACAGDGTEADRGTIHKIRKDLWLDAEHNIDSASFYGGATIDAFIIDYRRILSRLAKL